MSLEYAQNNSPSFSANNLTMSSLDSPPPTQNPTTPTSAATLAPRTPTSLDSPSVHEDIPETCTLILDFHQDGGITCGTTSFDLAQIYSLTTKTMVDNIEEVMLSLIHDAITCSQITTPEEQAVLFSTQMHEISFHHRERGKIVCFLLKHMALKIRNCLILNRSRPTPEPEICVFHVVFKFFIPESVRKCSQAPLSVMPPKRTFIGTAPAHAETAPTQGETLSTTRGLFPDNKVASIEYPNKTSVDSRQPSDEPVTGSQPKDRWPNVDRSRIGEFDRDPNNSGPSRGDLETTSCRRPPDYSHNDNADLGQSFRVAPNPNGLRDQQQQQKNNPTYNQHGFGPPSPSTPGYASHDEDFSDYAYGTQELTADDYFLEFDKSVVNSKDFNRIQMVPAKQPGETWSTWYLRFSLHGTLHGVYIPPWESMDRNKIYGSWFQQFTHEKQRQIRTTMSGLIKSVLNMKGVLPADSPELSYALTGKDGYHILYGMMRKYHPRLTTQHLTIQIPQQRKNESIHQYLDRMRAFQRQESVYQRPWQERDLVSTALENLLPTIRHAVKPFIHPQLQNIPAGAPLPASLQIDQLSITIEEALRLTGSDRTSSAIAKNTETAVIHSIDESYFSSAESLKDETNVEEDMDLVLHALSNRAARTPKQCAICDATSHSTDKCFKLEHFLFSKMPVEVPHALKATFQPRLRRLMDNIAGLKAYQPSAPPDTSPASASLARRNSKPPRGKTIRSLLDIAEDIIEDDNAETVNRLDDDADVDGNVHSITMAPDDYVCTTIYESTALQCNAIEIRTSPIGVHSDMVHCCADAASFLQNTEDPKVADKDTISAQVDDGSNTTTTNHQALLWNYSPIVNPKHMQDAGGNRHEAVGIGYLMVPSSQPHGSVPIKAYYTPTIAATIISPSGFCRQLGHTYNTHVVATDHDNGQSTMTIRHRLRRNQDIVINCTSRNGLSFTDPPIPPSALQRTAPLPTKHLHARMIRAADLSDLDPIFDPCDDAPAEPVVSAPVSNSVAAPSLRIDDSDDRLLFVNHLNREALRILWHQRLGHMHDRRVAVMHKYAIGVPDLPMSSSADQCPTCMAAKMRKSARGSESSSRATQCYQGISIDFGFIIQASKNSSRRKEKVGFNGETCYVLIADHHSGTLHGKAMKTKAPPLQYFHRWLSAFAPNCPGKFVRTDQGGELGKCHAVQELFARHGYDMQLTGADASHQNGLAERPHQAIGNTIRAMLEGASLPAIYWPYAFYHFLRLSNCTIHDGHDFTPFEICSGKPPDLRLLRTFGCRVYVRPPGKRTSKLDLHVAKGIFLGYAKTWKNILWYDLSTHKVKLTTHARFDEGMNDLPSLPPNAAFLKRAQHGDFPPEADDISFVDLDVTDCPFAALNTEQVPVSCEHPTFGLELAECDLRLRVFLQDVVAQTTAANIRTIRRRYIGAYLVSINNHTVFSADDATAIRIDDAYADWYKARFG